MSAPLPSTVPRPFTALIGRDGDRVAVRQLLDQSGGSIVTLVGPAGVGKTRLAISVASDSADFYADGVVYLDLSTVTDPLQVLPMLLGALGIPDGDGAASRLARNLAERSLLLVIDNFEQVRDAAPALNACLAGAPEVRTLVTSQAPLRVRGEREYQVVPLEVPRIASPDALADDALSVIGASPAVELFVRRAQTLRPTFALTPANARAVAEICRQLDGLPLAIELAAARSNVLSPEALLTRLSAPLHILNSGPRDAPDRHQALQSAISWSYGLLPPEEALLLDRLSVFAGSFSLPAVEAVAGSEPIVFGPSFYAAQPELPPNEPVLAHGSILDLIDALVDHSLVQRMDSDGEEPRFRLFTTIRQFAGERLAARAATETIALRHATWFRSRAEGVWTERGIPLLEWRWLTPLEQDIDNFRAAVAWTTRHDPALASTFFAALGWHFYFFGRREEGMRGFELNDGRFDPATLSAVNRARNHYIRGILLVQFPDREREGIRQFELMLAEVEAAGIPWAVGFALLSLGISEEDAGAYEQALDYFSRARPLLAALDEVATTSNVDVHIASSLFGLGRFDEARALAESIVALHPDEVGANLIYGLRVLGVMAIVQGEFPRAAELIRAYLDKALFYALGKVSTEAIDAAATIAVRAGDVETGAQLFGAADRANEDAGYALHYPEKPVYDAARAVALEALGQERFDALYRAGGRFGFEAAAEQVRAVLGAIAEGAPIDAATAGREPPSSNPRLTRRELEVLVLVAHGLTDKQIGDRLFISHRTARTHVSNILDKLDVPSRSAATTYALREGLVQLEPER